MGTSPSPRVRRERGSLTRESILAGAFETAAGTGIDGLSMPVLAKHLDVGVTSIYWHFRKKEDLIRSMSDQAIRDVQGRLPRPGDPLEWRSFLERHFRATREVYRSDDVLSDLILLHTNTYPLDATHLTFQNIEAIVAMLISAGFEDVDAWHVYGALVMFTRGTILTERIQRQNRSPILDDRQIRLIVPDTMPKLASLIRDSGIHLSMVGEDNFAFGLNALLDQFEGLMTGR